LDFSGLRFEGRFSAQFGYMSSYRWLSGISGDESRCVGYYLSCPVKFVHISLGFYRRGDR
jgi:hypothetical protein